jgi:SAM-dependent methyltransferase
MDLGETPEPIEQPVAAPVTFVGKQATADRSAVPKGAKTPPPWNYSLNETRIPPLKKAIVNEGPTPDDVIAAQNTPPRQVLPQPRVTTPAPEIAQDATTAAASSLGATPSDFFGTDPTPLPPSVPPTEEALGVIPASDDLGVTLAPADAGTSTSDSELSADSVELLPSSTEESPAKATTAAEETCQSPAPEEDTRADATDGPDPRAFEPREVEPEAVIMMADSSEHVLMVPGVEARSAASSATPPPVPPEAALAGPPKSSSPENQSKMAARGSTETTALPTRALDVSAAPSSRKAPEASGTKAAHAISESATPAAPSPPISKILAAALFDEYQTPASAGDALPEALARRSLQKRSKPWYEEVFDDDYLRTVPFMTPDQTTKEVNLIREALAVKAGGEVLDVGCGYGRHAIELAQQGVRVTGLDLSLPLLIKAADHAQKRGLSVNFVHADMREMTFSAQFDAAYCVLSSFGYFDEETNLRVATAICRSLKPGGRFLLDILNRDYIVGDLPSRVWWEGDGCVILEEVDFNYHTSRVLIRRSVVFGNGRQSEQELSMRAYSLHEVGRLLRQAGLRVLDVSGGLATKSRFFGAASRNIIAVCERPMP